MQNNGGAPAAAPSLLEVPIGSGRKKRGVSGNTLLMMLLLAEHENHGVITKPVDVAHALLC
jgi:hypothetical protein